MANATEDSATKKIKHLEMIQGIVNRLASNSFSLKGWSVAIVTALFALSAPDSNELFVQLAFFPAVIFWLLDGYYLWQERLFRKLYDAVREEEEAKIDFSMRTEPFLGKTSWLDATLSKTLIPFHGAIVGAIAIVAHKLICSQ